MLAGAAALGVIAFSACQHKGGHFLFEDQAPSACSARLAQADQGVSARAATVDAGDVGKAPESSASSAPVTKKADTASYLSQGFPDTTDEFKDHFAKNGAAMPKRGRENSEAVKKAKEELRPKSVELHNNAKSLGAHVLVPGRAAGQSAQPKVSGGCMFFQTDAYASALERDGKA